MTKEELKQLIMQQFENQNCKPNHVIPMRFWRNAFWSSLNPKEQDMFVDTVNELIEEKKIRYEQEGLESLRLTEIGYNNLYHNSKSSADIEEDIMDMFRRGNYKVGQVIMMRAIMNAYYNSLNPKEQGLFVPAINNLIDKRYIYYLENSPEALRLEQAGYDYIYKC